MSAQDETMRLIAEVVDKTTGPIKRMGEAFKSLGEESQKAHKKGSKEAREHAKHIRELHERLAKTKEFVSDALTPALATAGITVFSVGEAIGVMAEKIKAAGEQYNILNDTIKRGHVSSQFVQGMGLAFQRLGIDASKANGFISETGETLDKLRRGNAQEMQRLQGTFGNTLPWIERVLKGAQSYEEASTRIMKALTDERIPIDQRRKLADAFHIDPRIASKSGEELREQIIKSMRDATDHSLDFKLTKKLDDAYTELGIKIQLLSNDLVNTFGPGAVQMIDKLADSMGEVEKHIDDEVRDAKALYKVLEAIWDGPNIGWLKKTPGELWHDLNRPKDNSLAQPNSFNDWSPAQKLAAGMSPVVYRGSDAMKSLSEGVRDGVLSAFREWAGASAAPGSGGIQNASFTTRSGRSFHLSQNGSFGTGYDDGGSQIEGGNAHKGITGITPKRMPGKRLPKGTGGDVSMTGPDLGAGLHGSDYLRARRKPFMDEINSNPGLKDEVRGMLLTEGTPKHTMESLLNRMDYERSMGGNIKSVRRMLHSGFYGPINHGKLAGAIARIRRDPKLKARLDKAMQDAFGSNDLEGATDQGMKTDPNGRWRGGYKDFGGGNIFNDWGGGPGGHSVARRFREALEHGVAVAAMHGTTGAHLSDHIRHSVHEGIRSGMSGGPVKVQGDASLRVDLNGFPKGTRFASSASGMFKAVKLNRGRPMAMASQDS
ncbi:hypothetical protein QY049_03945 [Bradyrhizobium sp. WYCCWR 13022]|uniref:hypothetical protein n=1 Tax=unclassified Bradyrhizobium TaxID=2631580 RepID=UPI00263B0722|nr:hypothetical protein [Bradyrhizobium sp. WYCCWR 13022]MDN4982375.1 hypothetical protein [Bradyrhizobium sp. WYCCWR 13022]